jgi:hypothetical protein
MSSRDDRRKTVYRPSKRYESSESESSESESSESESSEPENSEPENSEPETSGAEQTSEPELSQSPTDSETELQASIQQYFLQELARKEKESEAKAEIWKRDMEKQKMLVKRAQRENVPFTFIQRPSASRLSIAPLYSETKDVEFREIDKTPLGNYLFMKFLDQKSETNSQACFVYPDLNSAIEAIELFYDIKKLKIKLPEAALDDWTRAGDAIKNVSPALYQKYLRTKDLVINNFESFKKKLRFDSDGPMLQRNVVAYNSDLGKKIFIYDKWIFSLLQKLLESQLLVIDTEKGILYSSPIKKIRSCLASGKRFIVMFLVLNLENDEGHANMVIIDTKKRTLERYEPQGLDPGFYDNDKVDELMRDFTNQLSDKIKLKYLGPEDFCITGLQDIVELKTMATYNFEGFCKTWSFLYALFRIIFGEEMDTKKLNENLHDIMVTFAKEYLEDATGKSIKPENYNFLIEFIYDYIPKILQGAESEIEKINQRLGTKLIYKGRTIYAS